MSRPRFPVISPTMVPFEEVEADLREIWSSGRLTSGSYVRRLEDAIAKVLDVPHAVAVGSCTSGLMLALRALDLRGEVILPTFTFTATGHAVAWNGLVPVFADCRPGTCLLDPASVEEHIGPKTSAIFPVHIFGVPADIDELEALARSRSLALVFDSAQALGARYHGQRVGGFGDVEVFSLSPTKVVTAMEGGIVTTRNGALADRIRQLRDYGKSVDGSDDIDVIGLSVRMSEFHAAVGLRNLSRLDEWIAAREARIARYKERLAGIPGLAFHECPSDRRGSGNYMVVFVDGSAGITRDGLREKLATDGIETKRYFYPALHRQRAYAHFKPALEGRLHHSERASSQGLALPLYAHMEMDAVDHVSAAVRRHVCDGG